MAYNNNYSYHSQGGGKNNKPQNQQYRSNEEIKAPEGFKPVWITNAIDEEGVKYCDAVAKSLKDVSRSFIRNIFGELKRIETRGFDSCRTDFFLLRPKVAYSTTRNSSKYAVIFKEVYNKMADNVTNNATFINLVRMTEAIIAYHRTYSNKE